MSDNFTLPEMPADLEPPKPRAPVGQVMRRTIGGTKEFDARAARRSVIDNRSVLKQATELHDRDEASYTAESATIEDTFSRRDNAGITLDETQVSALSLLHGEQFAIVGGYAGTGKTTIMKYAIPGWVEQVDKIDWGAFRTAGEEPNRDLRPGIVFCTFTNVAARNLASKLDPEWAAHCMSIHSLLAYAPVGSGEYNDETGRQKTRFEPRYHEGNKLPVRIIVVDELGIVSRDLWQEVLDACEPDVRIYGLGDLAQLPALKGVSPMPFAMKQWPTVILDTIYRQKGDNLIVPNLTQIRKGLRPQHDANDFRCGERETLPLQATKARTYIAAYLSTLYKMGAWDPKQDIIITPQNDAMLGQEHWNGAFRYAFNPKKLDENGRWINPPVLMQTALGVIQLAVGDKVMATDSGGRTAREKRFTNGSIGTIVSIEPNPQFTGDMTGLGAQDSVDHSDESDNLETMDALDFSDAGDAKEVLQALHGDEREEAKLRQASHIVTVVEQSTGERYILSRSAEVATLNHAYAATCHKFQGSQARHVMVICHSSMTFGLNREWLYTACSRAQKKVFLMHDPDALKTALGRQMLQGRNALEKAAHLERLYAARPFSRPEIPKHRALPLSIKARAAGTIPGV